MKFILKILFFIPILFISSCEELEDALPVDTDQFLGTWYSNQNMEQYMNFAVNSNQTVVPVESQIAGMRAFEGGIQVSGSGVNYSLNYNFDFFGDLDDGLLLTNMSAIELLPLMFASEYVETIPSGLVLLAMGEDSATVAIDTNVYEGAVNITWHIDFDDSLSLENLVQNSDLTLLSFNGISSLANIVNPSETISLSGSISFASSNLEANTPADYFEFLYGMTMSDLMSLSGDMGDDMTEELGLTLTINEDSTYTIISKTVESEVSWGVDTTFTVYDTCSGVWTVSNNKIHVDGSNEVCSDDESNYDPEGTGNSYTNIEIGLKSNGNLDLHLWNDSFCNAASFGMDESQGYDEYGYDEYGYDEYDFPSEEDCRIALESNLMLEPNSLSSFTSGAYVELSNTPNQNVFFNDKYFQSYLNRNMSKIRSSFLKKTQAGILENIK